MEYAHGIELSVATKILQGLLSSGHYTIPADESNQIDVEPDVFRVPFIKPEDVVPVFARARPCKAILDAIELSNELMKQIELDHHYDELKINHENKQQNESR